MPQRRCRTTRAPQRLAEKELPQRHSALGKYGTQGRTSSRRCRSKRPEVQVRPVLNLAVSVQRDDRKEHATIPRPEPRLLARFNATLAADFADAGATPASACADAMPQGRSVGSGSLEPLGAMPQGRSVGSGSLEPLGAVVLVCDGLPATAIFWTLILLAGVSSATTWRLPTAPAIAPVAMCSSSVQKALGRLGFFSLWAVTKSCAFIAPALLQLS